MPSLHRHRHFVALPLAMLAALFVLLSGGVAGRTITASVTGDPSSDSGVLSLPDGTQILTGERSAVDTMGAVPELTKGSMLVAHPGIVQVQVNGLSLSGLSGAFHVVKNGDVITVSALTSPVLITDGAQHAIVPAGYQWRGERGLPNDMQDAAVWAKARALEPLPSSFIRAQLLALDRFPDQTPPLPSAVTEIVTPVRFTFFAVAQERAQTEWRETVLGLLRHHLGQGDRVQAIALLTNEEVSQAFADARSIPVLAILTSQSCPSVPDVCALLLSRIAVQEDLWMPAAYHPALRSAVWAATIPALSPESRALLVFTLFPSDRQPVSLMPVIGSWWEEEVVSLLFASTTRETLFNVLANTQFPVMDRFATGFPERAEKMAASFRRIAERTGITLSSDLESRLKAVENKAAQTVDVSLLAEPVAEQSSASSARNTEPRVAVEHVDRVATSLLDRTDALFTTQTKIVPVDDQRAHVSGILFAGADGGDHAYSFDFNVVDRTISSIVRDEKEYPNALPLEKFLEWTRK